MEDICLQNLPVTLAIDRAGIVGADGETHHGIFDISYLLPMPNMTIYTPGDASQLKDALGEAVKKNGPAAVRYPRGKARDMKAEKNLDLSFSGKNIRLSSGKKVDILAVGTMLDKAIAAKEILSKKRIDCGIVNIAVIDKNFDIEDYIPEDKGKTLVVTLEDNVIIGGFGEYLGMLISAEDKKRQVLNLGWTNEFIQHGSQDELFAKYGLDGEGIARAIEAKLK